MNTNIISNTNYDQAIKWCHETISSGHAMLFSLKPFHQEISTASKKFGISFEALHSLFRNAHVTHMKRTAHTVKSQTMRHIRSYLNGTSIVKLAMKCNYPPSMMARLIVENITQPPSPSTASRSNKNNTSVNKKYTTEAIRHPEKMLGNASLAILSEYQFSERNGSFGSGSRQQNNDQSEISSLPMKNDTNMNSLVSQQRREDEVIVPLSRLAREVRHAIDSDPMYGPKQDRERHNIGIEYELLLEETLQSMAIPFETEAELRIRGTAKTPDVLLSCPVGIRVRRKNVNDEDSVTAKQNDQQQQQQIQLQGEENNGTTPISHLQKRGSVNLLNDDDDESDEYEWKIICWIDSKALFGDVETHTNSVLPQVETYVHRFGPGLVLYWFGHAPLNRLGDSHGDVVIVGGDLPEMMLMPTGDVHDRCGDKAI